MLLDKVEPCDIHGTKSTDARVKTHAACDFSASVILAARRAPERERGGEREGGRVEERERERGGGRERERDTRSCETGAGDVDGEESLKPPRRCPGNTDKCCFPRRARLSSHTEEAAGEPGRRVGDAATGDAL